MPFAKISQVKGWEDFGFQFKEGNDETAWDDAHGILTFRYTEPMTWWMPMPKPCPGPWRRPRAKPTAWPTGAGARPRPSSPAATTTPTARWRPCSATSPGTTGRSGA